MAGAVAAREARCEREVFLVARPTGQQLVTRDPWRMDAALGVFGNPGDISAAIQRARCRIRTFRVMLDETDHLASRIPQPDERVPFAEVVLTLATGIIGWHGMAQPVVLASTAPPLAALAKRSYWGSVILPLM